MSTSPTRQICSAMRQTLPAGRGHDAGEPAEDRLREHPLAREVLAIGGAGGVLGHPGLLERAVPVDVPVVDGGLVELGMELHAPRALADPEALSRARGRAEQLDRAV